MSYPNYPNNRLIVNGIDLTEEFKMVLVDGYTLEPPEPKKYTVDVPGGYGVIDLTESLSGDTAYDNRKQTYTFYIIDVENFEEIKTEIINLLHGKAYDYQITMDPDYTYHGRFNVDSSSHAPYNVGLVGKIVISVDADPFKKRPNVVKKVDAVGGVLLPLLSGRMRVRPTITTKTECDVIFNNKSYVIQPGSWIINDIVFSQGVNELYLCSHDVKSVTWGNLKNRKLSFGDIGERRIFYWYKSGEYNVTDVPEITIEYEWGDL